MRFNQKKDSGVAGLTILLSVIVMLFSIGLLVMIFALMGSELQTASQYTNTVSANETFTIVNTTGTLQLPLLIIDERQQTFSIYARLTSLFDASHVYVDDSIVGFDLLEMV